MQQIEILDRDYELARFLKALGNPVRLSIIRKLLEKGSCPHGCNPCACGEGCAGKDCKCGCKCGELVDMFSMSQSTISQHLKELKNAGLIESANRKGDYIPDHHRINKGLELLIALLGNESSTLFPTSENANEVCDCEGKRINRKYKSN